MARFLCLLVCLACAAVVAGEAVPAANPQLEARLLRIATELRCLVCQNQTLADSHAGLAEDLRREVRAQLQSGASDEQVLQFMTERYGDFVRYRPPLKGATALLWSGPPALLLGGLGVLALVLRRRTKLTPEQFEADVDDEEGTSTDESVALGADPLSYLCRIRSS